MFSFWSPARLYFGYYYVWQNGLYIRHDRVGLHFLFIFQMQWVVSHSQTLAYNRGSGVPPIWQRSVNHFLHFKKHFKCTSCTLTALEMHFTFCNNNLPARITVREATEQKLNILLEWPNIIVTLSIAPPSPSP